MNGSSTVEATSNPTKIWRSETSVTIPSADILNFAFANLGRYDANKPIWVDANDPSLSFSAGEARSTIRRLVKGFKAHGLTEGDCVCIVAYNNIWYPIVWLAVVGSSGIVTGANPSSTVSELIHHFKVTHAKYLLVQSECLHTVKEATSVCNISSDRVFLLSGPNQTVPDGIESLQTLLNHGECDWDTKSSYHTSIGDKPAAFNSTSGTTGLPKAAVITHRYVVAQTSMIETCFKDKPYQPSQLVCLPVFHAFAAQIIFVLPLRSGIATYLLPRFQLKSFSKAVTSFAITDTAVVPPIVTSLLHLPNDESYLLESLRYILCAGAPISAPLQSQLYKILSPDAVIAQVWGMTELGWTTMFTWSEKDNSGSVGRLLPNVELKLIEDNASIHEEGVSGEAYLRSPSTFTRYHYNPEATASSFDSEGFYRTGDRVYVKENRIFIVGRVKDTMKIKGWQVSPSEIESVLCEHPGIADAAVVGITVCDDDGLISTLPRAFVVPRIPTSDRLLVHLTEQEVIDFAASKLASYKKLTGGVSFVDEIPRNPTGKILHRLLSREAGPVSPAMKSESSVAISTSEFSDELILDGSEDVAKLEK